MNATRWSQRRGWRAFLFVPPGLLHKAADPDLRRAGPLICDLEDAAPAEQKDEARLRVAAHLSAGPPVYVRINASTTEWFERDLTILRSPHLLGVVLPKAESPVTIDQLREVINDGASIVPLIETAAGLERANMLAMSPSVERLAFGALDFRRDLRLGCGPLELLYARSRLVVVSRATGLLQPLDSVDTDLSGGTRLAAQARRARRLGFGGKLCVHPSQVAVVNRELAPSLTRIEWARRILSDPDRKPRQLDGEMVDAPVIAEAQDLLEEASWPKAPPS